MNGNGLMAVSRSLSPENTIAHAFVSNSRGMRRRIAANITKLPGRFAPELGSPLSRHSGHLPPRGLG
jgi:hypothetical protein